MREVTLSYKRVGDVPIEAGKSCDDPTDAAPKVCESDGIVDCPSSVIALPIGGFCAGNTCKIGTFCITPSCYSRSEPTLQYSDTLGSITTIPSAGCYVDIISTQLGMVEGAPTTAPINSKIVFGAFYTEPIYDTEENGDTVPPDWSCVVNNGCNWLQPENQNQPKCGCSYPNLSPREPNLWTTIDPENRTKTWTQTKITNVYIPPGTGKGYKLQVVVNGAGAPGALEEHSKVREE